MYLSANPSSDADREFNMPPIPVRPADPKPLIVFRPITVTSKPPAVSTAAAAMSPLMIAALAGLALAFFSRKGRS